MSSYYDIDSILAEEELIPSTTLFDFSHLSYLDPEGRHHHHRQQQQQRRSKHDDNHDEDGQPQQQQQHERGGGGGMTSHLPEGSQIKMPLWALDKWSTLGYVQMSLPRHFSRKARERLDADPGEADLRYVKKENIGARERESSRERGLRKELGRFVNHLLSGSSWDFTSYSDEWTFFLTLFRTFPGLVFPKKTE